LIVLAESRNDFQWEHNLSLVLLIGRAFSGGQITKAEIEKIKPGGG